MNSVYSFCHFFTNNNHQQLIQYYAEYVLIIISTIIAHHHISSYHNHIRIIEKHSRQYAYVETQVLGGKPQKPYNNSFPATIGRRQQPPCYNDFNSPATTRRRLQSKESSNSLVLLLQPERGYNPLSLPYPAILI